MVNTTFSRNLSIWSSIRKNIAAIVAKLKTITAPIVVSFLDGQLILKVSCLTAWINFNGFIIIYNEVLAGAEGLEPTTSGFGDRRSTNWTTLLSVYFKILVTTPAPTVLPPSLIAKFKLSFIAIGVINFTVNFPSSPGITISVPAGKVTSPVTSVVLK